MIYIVLMTYDEISMVSESTKKITEFAVKHSVFESGGRIEAWQREKRKGVFFTMKEYKRAIKPDSDDDDDISTNTFW